MPAQITPPAALVGLRNWLVWRLVAVEGQPKPRKVPYYTNGSPRGGTQGSPEDRAQLASLEEAQAVLARGGYSGLGFAPLADSGIVALDFDHCIDEFGMCDPAVEALCYGSYSEVSPSGTGLRAFFRGALQSNKDVDGKRGPFPLEVFGHNGYVTFTGNITPAADMFGWMDAAPLTIEVIQHIVARGWSAMPPNTAMPGGGGDEGEGDLATLTTTLGLSLAQVAAKLALLPKDLDYDDWIKTGAATHHETMGQGFDLWHRWSMQSPKYTTEAYCAARWDSFGKYRGAPITFAWVVKLANENAAKVKYLAVDEWAGKIKESREEFDLREHICKGIARDDRMGDDEREALAQVLCDHLRGIGKKYPIASVRNFIDSKMPKKDVARTDQALPEWGQGWLYVTAEDKFHRLGSDEWLTVQGFNARFNRYMPTNDAGQPIQPASWGCLNDYGLDTVTKAMYLPWADQVFEHEGVRYVNRYRPSVVPQAVSTLSPQGQAAVDDVMRHLTLLCDGRQKEIETILSWLAHNVQNPGRKIRWAPLIKGVEGDGKSLLGSLLQAVMGRPNVRNVSPTVLGTDFSGWAEGSSVVVLEEVKLHGHNRYDIFNALKPKITNDSVPIHRKGKDEYEIINVSNYIAFTNYPDALPIGDTDRRWWIIFTPFHSRGEMEAMVRQRFSVTDLGAYFDRLHAAIEQQRAELRRWLLDWAIPTWFKPNGSAPYTAERALMIALSAAPEDEAIREVLDDGASGVGTTVLSSACLSRAMATRDTTSVLNTTTLNRALIRMGWTKVLKLVKWKGLPHRVWVKGINAADNEAIRLALEQTEVVGGAQVDPNDLF